MQSRAVWPRYLSSPIRWAIGRSAWRAQVRRRSMSTTMPAVGLKAALTTTNDPLLFTPGPLTTSSAVKLAGLHDYGSRDGKFIEVVRDVRRRVCLIAGDHADAFTCIPVQGSGTFALEGVISSVVPKAHGGLLVAVNGAYGQRLVKIGKLHGIHVVTVRRPEHEVFSVDDIRAALDKHSSITTVAMVHSETTSGVINPLEEIGELVSCRGKHFIVDAMSSFGGIPIAMNTIDFLVSSSNKCIQGIPGFSFVVARKSSLASTAGNSRTMSLDIHEQDQVLNETGQFRFTPPVQSLLSFQQALKELVEEGGVQARYERYLRLQNLVMSSFSDLGFEPYVQDSSVRGPIITSFLYPEHERWNFEVFYSGLRDRGFLIYPGKVTECDCFRIGHIGYLFEHDVTALVDAAKSVLKSMQVEIKRK